ncbi:hypothetical protein Tco_0915861, partial [Tanacetum coccineum]
YTYNSSMASLTLFEELSDVVGYVALHHRIRMWFHEELAKEEGFANTVSRFRLDLVERIVKRRKMRVLEIGVWL